MRETTEPVQVEAGRELDARVAEQIMGWGWMTRTNGDVLPFKRWLVPPEEFGDWGHVHPADLSLPMEEPWWLDAERCRGLRAGHTPVPAYSTEIAAAWPIPGAMGARYPEFIAALSDLLRVETEFALPIAALLALQPAEAASFICRAALATVEAPDAAAR